MSDDENDPEGQSPDDPLLAEAEDLLAELDFSGRPRINGGATKATQAILVRDLTRADLAALNGPRGVNTPKSIQRIRSSHHALARCLASGMNNPQAGLVTGYSQSRVYLLQQDPAFIALVEEYKNEAKEIFADLQERMTNISLDAIEELQERLDASPEGFSIGMLLDVVKAFADRTGHGPGQEVKLSVSSSMIDRPPKETYEEWQKRRARELGAEPDIGSLEPPTGTPN